MIQRVLHHRSENTQCIVYMVIAMAGFAVEDAVIKALSADLPVSQILVLIGLCGMGAFFALAQQQGAPLFTRALATTRFAARGFCELASAIAFVSSIVYASLSVSSAILQAAPLVVSLGGVLFLKQMVSLRQWLLIGAGFVGVILIIQPGTDAFQPATLLSVVAVVFLAARDLVTRSMSVSVGPVTVSFWAFFALFLAGVVTVPIFGAFQPITTQHVLLLVLSTLAGTVAYLAVVMATRGGDVAAVAPFRYSRLVFALALSVLLFDEPVNTGMLVGSALVILSGLGTLRRVR
mgnify:CR=1 FL=1